MYMLKNIKSGIITYHNSLLQLEMMIGLKQKDIKKVIDTENLISGYRITTNKKKIIIDEKELYKKEILRVKTWFRQMSKINRKDRCEICGTKYNLENHHDVIPFRIILKDFLEIENLNYDKLIYLKNNNFNEFSIIFNKFDEYHRSVAIMKTLCFECHRGKK